MGVAANMEERLGGGTLVSCANLIHLLVKSTLDVVVEARQDEEDPGALRAARQQTTQAENHGALVLLGKATSKVQKTKTNTHTQRIKKRTEEIPERL
jgi:hypothetical protein